MPPSHARENGEVTDRGRSVSRAEGKDSKDTGAGLNIEPVWESYQQTKQEMKKGRLVSWQDAFKSQKVSNVFTIDL